MFRQSADLTNPMYLTMLSCCRTINIIGDAHDSRGHLICSREGSSGDRSQPVRRQHDGPNWYQFDPYLDHPQLALRQIDELDLLDSNSLAGTPVKSLVDGTEGTFAYTFPQSLFATSSQPRPQPRLQPQPHPGHVDTSACGHLHIRNLSGPGLARPSRGHCSPSSACWGFDRVGRRPHSASHSPRGIGVRRTRWKGVTTCAASLAPWPPLLEGGSKAHGGGARRRRLVSSRARDGQGGGLPVWICVDGCEHGNWTRDVWTAGSY